MSDVIAANETGNSDTEHTLSVSAPGNSDWFTVAQGTQFVECELIPGAGGTAKVQATLDRVGAKADTVDAVDWTPGLVTTRTQLKWGGGGLIRLVSTIGAAQLILKVVKA